MSQAYENIDRCVDLEEKLDGVWRGLEKGFGRRFWTGKGRNERRLWVPRRVGEVDMCERAWEEEGRWEGKRKGVVEKMWARLRFTKIAVDEVRQMEEGRLEELEIVNWGVWGLEKPRLRRQEGF